MFGHKHHKPYRTMLIVTACAVLTFDSLTTSWRDHPCYADAQIGYDSVINARVGVPADEVISIAAYRLDAVPEQRRYSTDLLNLILNAYMWKASPYEYSTRVFYHCTVTNRPLVSTDLING